MASISAHSSPSEETAIPLLNKFEEEKLCSLRMCFLRIRSILKYKSVLIVILWQFSTGLVYNLLIRPTRYIQMAYIDDALWISIISSLIFMLTPVAGFVADVKSSRIRLMRYGTVIILLSVLILLVSGICLSLNTYHFNTSGLLLVSTIILSSILYTLGQILFLSNVVQFGTDQLRDAPTRYSVYFIHAYFWVDGLGFLIASATSIPGHEIVFNVNVDKIAIATYRAVAIGVVFVISILLTSALLCVLYSKKYSTWFLSENSMRNPYKLVYNVLYYAILHKRPMRRSAFTFCDNERPTRLDFGKHRFGGPFSTEQVEDVKVMLNVVAVMVSISPVFLLEGVAAFSFKNHVMHTDITFHVDNPFLVLLVNGGMIVPLAIIICIPLFHFAGKRISLKYTPNILKKIGISISVLVVFFLVYIVYDTFAYESSMDLGFFYTYCEKNSTYELNKSLFTLQAKYVSSLQQILFAVFQVLLYTSSCEMICCQSPEYMKGLLFGSFYALRAFNHCLAAGTIYLLIHNWHSTTLSCRSAYYIICLCIASVSLVVYINMAKKFKYRKRDDVCNIYKFAEDYYSNIK